MAVHVCGCAGCDCVIVGLLNRIAMAAPLDGDSTGLKFPNEVTAILERLYSRGMTGWGKDHTGDIDIAIGSTGLTLSQVKVCR